MSKVAAWTLAAGVAVALGTMAAQPAQAARAYAAEDPASAAGARQATETAAVLAPGRLTKPRVTFADRDGDGIVSAEEATAYFAARFARMDTNKDGVLSEAEFLAGDPVLAPQLVAFEPPRRERSDGFSAFDLDGDGHVSAEEFILSRIFAAGRANPDQRRERRATLFGILDLNRDGVVSRDEFMAVGARYFAGRDLDSDGQVTIWEFRTGPLF